MLVRHNGVEGVVAVVVVVTIDMLCDCSILNDISATLSVHTSFRDSLSICCATAQTKMLMPFGLFAGIV